MDCEKFDQHVMDALYGELDDLTNEALKRHVEACGRCAGTWSSLKSTRAALTLPVDEPSFGLEARILAAEKAVSRKAPFHRKILRGAAWAGSHAMRPQLAMAALFVFVVGSSLLLLRAKPGPPVEVSEQGRPESQPARAKGAAADRAESRAAAPMASAMAAPRPMSAPADDSPRDPLADAAGASAIAATPPAATQAAAAGDAGSAGEMLARGRTQKSQNGCDAAVPTFQGVITTFPDSSERTLAEEEIAACRSPATPAASASGPSGTATTVMPSVSGFENADGTP